MTDRELIELAAKAAGIEWDKDLGIWIGATRYDWNPLADDGDAFRLGVKLGLFEIPNFDMHHCERGNFEEMRIAIVKAAADIGRNL